MKSTLKRWLRYSPMILLLAGTVFLHHTRSVQAQANDDFEDYDGIDVYAYIDIDSNGYLYADSYTELEFDLEEDIDAVADDLLIGQDDNIIDEFPGYEDEEYSESDATSNSPVAVGHEYEVEADGYACFDDGEGDCDGFDYVGSAFTAVYLPASPPQISSINPTSVVTGSSGTLTVSGSHLVGTEGDNPVASYSASGVTFTLQGTPSATQASFSYQVDQNAPVGTNSFSLSTGDGASNNVNFTVGYPAAVVTSLSPSTWTAGSSFTLTIGGTGFGNSPTVSISGGGVQYGQAMNTSPDGTQTQVTVSVQPNAPSESVSVTVQPGYSGSGFTCGNCNGGSGAGSNMASVEPVTPAPQIMFNGANISGTTQGVVAGQQIAFSVPTPNGYNIQSQSWSFSNQSAITGGFVNGAGTPGTQPSASAGGTEAADPSLNQNSLTFYWVNPGDNGETVTYTYTLDNGQSNSATATFNIDGPSGSLLPIATMFTDGSGVQVQLKNGVPAIVTTGIPHTGGSVGITFRSQAGTPVGGQNQAFQWVQILNGIQDQDIGGGGEVTTNEPPGQLDGTYPYANETTTTTSDSPNVQLPQSYGMVERGFTATMYLMWDPALPTGCVPAQTNAAYNSTASTCTSIPIPLGSVQWKWSGCAINTLIDPGTGVTWIRNCGIQDLEPAQPASSTGFPQWTTTHTM